MRLIVLLAFAGAGSIMALQRPLYAILFYVWLAYLRPDYWLYTGQELFAGMSLASGVWAVLFTTISGRLRFGVGPAMVFALLAVAYLSTVDALLPPGAMDSFVLFMKVVVTGYLLYCVVDTPKELRLVLMVIAMCLSVHGARQGWLGLLTRPGTSNTNSLPMLGDNNGVAVGMLMLTPILIALAHTSRRRSEALFHRFLAIGTVYRAFSTFSRGGFLAALALGAHYLAAAKKRLRALLAIAAIAGLIAAVLPASFWERISTVPTSQAELQNVDDSSAGRLHFWRVAVQMAAVYPVTGVGIGTYWMVYDRFDFSGGRFGSARYAHSIWFSVLAEIGYVGLALYVGVLIFAFSSNTRVALVAARHPEGEHLAVYARAFNSALIAFVVGGTFLSNQYSEMAWHIVFLSFIVARLTRALEMPASVDAAPASAVRIPTRRAS